MTYRQLPLVGINLLYARPGYVGGTMRYAEALIPALARLGCFRLKLYVQAGAFQNAPDADNLKARLALLGVQASIQTTTLPDRGVWHRVRLGPYGSVEELNRTRDTLKNNGIDTTLIKVRDADK